MRPILGHAVFIFFCFAFAEGAGARSFPKPSEYGKVIIRTSHDHTGMGPVQFDHWLHRTYYTCRLCHVDVGFAMEANATQMRAELIVKGFYCGSCHDGQSVLNGRKIFASCSPDGKPGENGRCTRCHSAGMSAVKKNDYQTLTREFPRLQSGALIDWEEAEARGHIRPADFIPGTSIQRPALKAQMDFEIVSKSYWAGNVLFSHKKHALWNGCEVCHPDIFPSVKKGTVKYSMFQISGGQYCGLCHNTVAFPINYCQKCHVSPRQ